MRWFWLCVLVIGGLACTQEQAPPPVDREALKAELRAELLAELREMALEPATSEPKAVYAAQPVPLEEAEPEALVGEDDTLPSVNPAEATGSPAVAPDPLPIPVAKPVAEPTPTPEQPKKEAEPAVVPIVSAEALPEVLPHPSLAVVRLDVATGVNRELREPENVGTNFSLATTSMLYAYMAIQNKGNPAEILVEWYRAGTRRSHITLNVGHSIRGWRTWSKVRLGPKDSGPWEVHVLDGSGRLLHRAAFEVSP